MFKMLKIIFETYLCNNIDPKLFLPPAMSYPTYIIIY